MNCQEETTRGGKKPKKRTHNLAEKQLLSELSSKPTDRIAERYTSGENSNKRVGYENYKFFLQQVSNS